MPSRPPRQCSKPGCGRVDCWEHRKDSTQRYDDERGTSAERGYDHDWRDARLRKLKRDPICEPCASEGRTTGPTPDNPLIVHHLVPLAGLDDPLRLVQSNLLTVCAGCHARIHAALAVVN